MNISSFYNLKDRLYACAAAGCGSVSEDFRLKRALEEFAPLAQANKVFDKIYVLCQKLFDSENPASVLAECIALADAVAVTQGVFADGCDTVQTDLHAGIKAPVNVPYSEVSELCEKIRKCSPKLANPEPADIRLLGDSRVLASFISACDGKSAYLDEFAHRMFECYGKKLVPLLKKSENFSSGTRIEYISLIAGEEENDYFISLAENENLPQNVCISAIGALSCTSSNAPKLAELYKTRKGKIKSAALDALGRMDSPETEEIFSDLLEKNKLTDEVISHSSSKVCTDYAVALVKKDCAELKEGKRENKKTLGEYISLLENKPFADEGFLVLSENHLNVDAINMALVRNLHRQACRPNSGREYHELIHRLYRKNSEAFLAAEFYARLTENPEAALEFIADGIPDGGNTISNMFKNIFKCNSQAQLFRILDLFYIFRGIYFSAADGRYGISWRWCGTLSNYPPLWIAEDFPQFILDLVCMEARPEEKDRVAVSSDILYSLLNNCKQSDFERIRKSAVKFAFSSIKNAPCRAAMDIITEFNTDGTEKDYRGLTTEFILNCVKNKTYCRVDFIDRFPLSEEEKFTELTVLIKKLEALGEENKAAVKYQLNYITTYLKYHKK